MLAEQPVPDRASFNVTEYFDDDRRFILGAVTHYEGPDIWALERYSWGPGWLSIKAEESNFCCAGDGTDLQITANEDGGSHVELDWERAAATPEWEPLMAVMAEQGEELLIMAYRDRLDQLADAGA